MPAPGWHPTPDSVFDGCKQRHSENVVCKCVQKTSKRPAGSLHLRKDRAYGNFTCKFRDQTHVQSIQVAANALSVVVSIHDAPEVRWKHIPMMVKFVEMHSAIWLR
jgi:hypothetical protein